MDFQPGAIEWIELHTSRPSAARDFYARLAGWIPEEEEDATGDEFQMLLPESEGEPVAGIIHRVDAAGGNAIWIPYIVTEDLVAALARAEALGAEIEQAPDDAGEFGQFAIIRDPFGALTALFQPSE